MNYAPQSVTGEFAKASVLEALGMKSQEATNTIGPALYAEVIRAALWAEWSSTGRPVYSTRLLNGAARTLLPWQEAQNAEYGSLLEQLRNTLQEMEIIGDLTEVPGGRWAPTPPRVVQFPVLGRWLLLGGQPARHLPKQALETIERTGVARLLPCDPSSVGLKVDSVAEHEWLRTPAENLEVWARAVLEASSLGEVGEIDVELYAPAAVGLRETNQFSRWTGRKDRIPDGRYLARTNTRRGSRIWYIVQLTKGSVTLAGPPSLGDGDVRRLQYGIDKMVGNPVRVSAVYHHDELQLKLGSELPRAEHCLLLAIGRLHTPPDGKYYPRWWHIPIRYATKAQEALGALGIKVDSHR